MQRKPEYRCHSESGVFYGTPIEAMNYVTNKEMKIQNVNYRVNDTRKTVTQTRN